MVGDIESNVVDGPISWRALSAGFRGWKKMDHFGPARLAEALVQGRPNKTMPDYYDESPAFDRGKLRAYKTAGRTLAIFRKMQSWSGMSNSS